MNERLMRLVGASPDRLAFFNQFKQARDFSGAQMLQLGLRNKFFSCRRIEMRKVDFGD